MAVMDDHGIMKMDRKISTRLIVPWFRGKEDVFMNPRKPVCGRNLWGVVLLLLAITTGNQDFAHAQSDEKLGPILKTLVPHFGHTPWVAGFLFFIVIAFAFFISTLVRHFIQ